MRISKFTQLSAFLGAMLAIPQLGLAQDASEFAIDFEDVVAIVGGQESLPGRFPSTTAILRVSPTQNLFQRQFCAGTAISDSYILTAAHCMFNAFGVYDPDDLAVAGNFVDLLNDSPAEIPVAEIFVHESYDESARVGEHDIAIIRTKIPHNIPPITLFSGNSRSLTDADAYIAGWGGVEPSRPTDITNSFPTVLNEARVPVTDFNTCNNVYQGELTSAHICAGFARGGVDACQGDSGGPLMIDDGDKLIQIGITSFGAGCAQPNAFGVYSNVEQYQSFINRIVPAPSSGKALFESPKEFASGSATESGLGSFGLGSLNMGMLVLLVMAVATRARRSRLFMGRFAGVSAAALFATGCATGYPLTNNDSAIHEHANDSSIHEHSAEPSGSSAAVNKVSSTGLIKVSSKSSNAIIGRASLVKKSSDHKDLPMFNVAALSEKRESAIETATAHYGVQPVCESKKVAPKNSKRADLYERCEFVGMAKAFDGGSIQSVTYHFMSNRIAQIDATLHGPAFVLSPMANTLDDILGESVFSVGESDATAGAEALPQAVYHWSEPRIAYARLMTEAGADTESFLFTLQHSGFAGVIPELDVL